MTLQGKDLCKTTLFFQVSPLKSLSVTLHHRRTWAKSREAQLSAATFGRAILHPLREGQILLPVPVDWQFTEQQGETRGTS